MAKRDENNNIDENAKRNINAVEIKYFINGRKYTLPKYSLVNKKN
ncbi:hypothetical protein [Brachyspira alvinipulli]|nr:hypothetical protein [Brachyspira alvinipulli]